MPIKIRLLKFTCCAAACLAFAATSSRAGQQRRPSVVLVIIDSVRADHTSPYGGPKSVTPELEKLAGQGFVFENTRSDSNWTAPSIATMLTGKRPFSHGLLGTFDNLPMDARTVQSLMADNGYETAVFLTGLPGTPKYGLARSFGHVTAAERGWPMSRHVADALAWQSALPPEKDFFMVIHGNDAHFPYNCSEESPLKAAGFPDVGFGLIRYYSGFPGWVLRVLDPEKWKEAVSYRDNKLFLAALSKTYDTCISRLDTDIGTLVKGLEAQKRPVLLIITADHGEFLGEHGTLGHGRYYYDPVVKVPLIIRFPGESRGRRVRTLAEHVDLLPTICKAAGISCPEGLDGKDLASAAEKENMPEKWAAAGDSAGNLGQTVRTAVFSEKGKTLMLSEAKWKLFDLAADPGETKDIAREQPADFLKLASGYLAFSRFEGLSKAPPISEEAEEDCAPRSQFPPRGVPPGAGPCERARAEAEELARAGDFDGAAARISDAGCPPGMADKDKELLKMLQAADAPARSAPHPSYMFSAVPGRWKIQKDGFSVIYSTGNGLECENDKGMTVSDPGCVPPAEGMLNCAEKYRFTGGTDNAPNAAMEESLRRAGYMSGPRE